MSLRLPLVSIFTPSLLLLVAGCGQPQPKTVPERDRLEAASLVSEGEFAAQLKDYPRAETLLAKATALDPEQSDVWLALGYIRKQQDNPGGARDAYEEALAAAERAYNGGDKNAALRLHQAYIHALMGEVDTARKLVEQTLKEYPDSREARGFIENKTLDRMLADPAFKSRAL